MHEHYSVQATATTSKSSSVLEGVYHVISLSSENEDHVRKAHAELRELVTVVETKIFDGTSGE
jgi:hypothetical protein